MAEILCIDIGGTRIKAAVLNSNITKDELKNINVRTMETLGWMNSSLPKIINKDHPASLIHENESLNNYNSIAIGVPLEVIDNGKRVEGHYLQFGLPHNLYEAFKSEANCDNCDITITNDSVAWIRGILKYLQLSSININFPSLTIILGTGIGLGYSDLQTIKGLELNTHNHYYKNISHVVNENIDKGGKIHDLLGEKFFHDIKDNHKTWTYSEIQNIYTERLTALIRDIEEANLFNYKEVKSIIIGGGNSKYLSLTSLTNNLDKSIYMLNNTLLKINPDLICLLGLLSLANKG